MTVPLPGYATSTNSWNKRAECGYAGLANQGATCYMNSLLQVGVDWPSPLSTVVPVVESSRATGAVSFSVCCMFGPAIPQALFMTPEFRRAMYAWQVRA